MSRPHIIHEGQVQAWPHPYPFDPTYGHDRSALLAVRPPANEPADFAAFWHGTYAANERLPLSYRLEPVAYPDPTMRAYKITFASWGECQSGAWLVEPAQATPAIGCVIGHGYGGRTDIEPGPWTLNSPEDRDVARIFPVARGFHISAMEDLPLNHAGQHVVHGITSRETYVLRGCVAEQWTCSRILLDRHPHLAGKLVYSGGSFGGGIGALMLPWCDRFVAAHLQVPTFGHHPLRLTYPSIGSGEAVRLHAERNPDVIEVLRYFDAATAATHIRIPVLAGAALFDPGVPPPGQFAVCNALAGETELFIQSVGHFTSSLIADEGPEQARCASEFLRRRTLLTNAL